MTSLLNSVTWTGRRAGLPSSRRTRIPCHRGPGRAACRSRRGTRSSTANRSAWAVTRTAGFGGLRLDRIERLPRDHEQVQDDDGGDDRPDDLDEVVAVELRGQLRVGRLAPVAHDDPDDRPFDREEDRRGQDEDDVVEVPGRLALAGDVLGRVEARSRPAGAPPTAAPATRGAAASSSSGASGSSNGRAPAGARDAALFRQGRLRGPAPRGKTAPMIPGRGRIGDRPAAFRGTMAAP